MFWFCESFQDNIELKKCESQRFCLTNGKEREKKCNLLDNYCWKEPSVAQGCFLEVFGDKTELEFKNFT